MHVVVDETLGERKIFLIPVDLPKHDENGITFAVCGLGCEGAGFTYKPLGLDLTYGAHADLFGGVIEILLGQKAAQAGSEGGEGLPALAFAPKKPEENVLVIEDGAEGKPCCVLQ